MSSVELNLYNILKNDFHLSDEKAMEFLKSVEDIQEKKLSHPIEELSNKLDLKFEQINARFEQVNTKFEQVYTRIENSKADTLKWFMGGFVTIILTILGLIATMLFKQ